MNEGLGSIADAIKVLWSASTGS